MAGLLIADFSSFFDISIGLHELKMSYLNVQFCVWCDSFPSKVDRQIYFNLPTPGYVQWNRYTCIWSKVRQYVWRKTWDHADSPRSMANIIQIQMSPNIAVSPKANPVGFGFANVLQEVSWLDSLCSLFLLDHLIMQLHQLRDDQALNLHSIPTTSSRRRLLRLGRRP